MSRRAFFVPASLRIRKAARPTRWAYDEVTLHRRLAQVIELRGGIEAVAKASDLRYDYIRRCFSSQTPSVENLFYIAEACGVSIDYLVGRNTIFEIASRRLERFLDRRQIKKEDFDRVCVTAGFIAGCLAVWMPTLWRIFR